MTEPHPNSSCLPADEAVQQGIDHELRGRKQQCAAYLSREQQRLEFQREHETAYGMAEDFHQAAGDVREFLRAGARTRVAGQSEIIIGGHQRLGTPDRPETVVRAKSPLLSSRSRLAARCCRLAARCI